MLGENDVPAVSPGLDDFVRSLPKAELHLHIEGTLEPEMMMAMAARHGVRLPFADVAEARDAYVFEDLQSFLDLYYAACDVLRTEEDFFELTSAYLERAAADGVRHAEIFFDPQTHTTRGVPLAAVISGIHAAAVEAGRRLGMTSGLILSFLRHLSEDEAMETLEEAMPYREWLTGVGLDSSETGNPPAKFRRVFELARSHGLHTVAHAGEEGPCDYISQSLDVLSAERIDHGVRCLDDERLVERLVSEQVPLTICPLSNVKLRIFPSLGEHPLAALLARGLLVTVNSDDPAYFGGYIAANYLAAAEALSLRTDDIVRLARNSFLASFLPEEEKRRFVKEIDERAEAG